MSLRAPASEPRTYLFGCTLLDSDFKVVRRLPGGYLCQVSRDGSWISSNGKALTYWSATGEKLWTVPGTFHHQIRENPEGDILVLKEESLTVSGFSLLYDVVEKWSKGGKLLAAWSARENLSQLGFHHSRSKNRPLLYPSPIADRPFPEGLPLQFTHFNSIQVLTTSQGQSLGGTAYLVHDPILGRCLGLSADLKRITWSVALPDTGSGFSIKHDCQLTPDNEVLYFDNVGLKWKDRFSYSIVLLDTRGTRLFSFPKFEKDFAAAPARGAVEPIGKDYLISIIGQRDTTVLRIDRAGKILKRRTLDEQYQEVKSVPFDGYLEKNRVR